MVYFWDKDNYIADIDIFVIEGDGLMIAIKELDQTCLEV